MYLITQISPTLYITIRRMYRLANRRGPDRRLKNRPKVDSPAITPEP